MVLSGLLALVLTTGSHTTGGVLPGVETGLAHCRRLLCYKNGGAFGGPFPT